MGADADRIRLDKWLWAARFFKTRSLASQAIDLGRIRIEGERIKPAREARVGELLDVQVGDQRLQVVIRALSTQRGPASIARE
jgi:ribosome-associated heat shock protein Hsp15